MRISASSCPSVRLSVWNNSAPTERIFIKFDVWVFSENLSKKIQVSLKSEKNKVYFTWRPQYIFDHISLSSSYNEKCLDKSGKETHALCLVAHFKNSFRLRDNVEKYCRAGQAIDGNMAHAHSMLDNIFFFWRCDPTQVIASSFLRFSRSHTTTHPRR